jgi:hypothetical protein
VTGAFGFVIFAIYLFVHIPLIQSLEVVTANSQQLLLILPLSVIRTVPQINTFLEQKISQT